MTEFIEKSFQDVETDSSPKQHLRTKFQKRATPTSLDDLGVREERVEKRIYHCAWCGVVFLFESDARKHSRLTEHLEFRIYDF